MPNADLTRLVEVRVADRGSSKNAADPIDEVLVTSWLDLMENVRNRDRKKAFYWEPLLDTEPVVLPPASVIEKNLEKVKKKGTSLIPISITSAIWLSLHLEIASNSDSDSAGSSECDDISLLLTPTSTASATTDATEHEHPGVQAWLNYADRMARDYESEGSAEEWIFWDVIEYNMAITDAFDTGLSVEGQEMALWEDMKAKMAITDKYDIGLGANGVSESRG
ncbi:hypothetical protein BDZ45DRAFT_740364 [Acephala macrosclerotiorum]|nr:hypothetical protein BDZ45DRAFT_740364 [Acephala macrosclerotiorum]